MKYLIVKTSSLGDILQTFPLVSYLRHKSPYGTIEWLVEEKFSSLVCAHPQVDRVLTMRRRGGVPFCHGLRKRAYDVLFDVQGNCKSGLLTLLADAKAKVGFAWKQLPEWPNGFATNVKFSIPKGRNIRDDYCSLAYHYFNDFSSVKVEPFLFPLSDQEQMEIAHIKEGTLICPGAAWPSKQLSKEQWISILKKLDGKIQFVWGSEKEREFVEDLAHFGDILPRLTLAQLQNIMARSKRVIAMDSLPLHLCATTNTPAFGFFGPSSMNKFLAPNFQGIQGVCPFQQRFEGRCPKLRSCEGLCVKDVDCEIIKLF